MTRAAEFKTRVAKAYYRKINLNRLDIAGALANTVKHTVIFGGRMLFEDNSIYNRNTGTDE